MKVSFIIPLYNGLVLTQAMLASLRATVPAHLTHEIIFADDGSTDGTRDWLASLPPPCRFLLNEKNLGFAGTCNRGAAAAQGELIFFLNNDLVLLPGWLEPMQAALHSSQRPGIVGNIQINAATGMIDHTGIEISSAAKLVHSHWQPWSLSRFICPQRTVPAVTAACCVLPRETFLREGGFDESFRNGGEDIDLCWRLAQRGYGVIVAFKSVVRHHIRASRGPVSLADEANTQRLFARWRKEIIALGDQCWAKNTIRQFFINPCSVNGFTLLSALAYRAGWRIRPPRAMALAFDSALHYEELHWQQRLAGTIKPVVYPPSAYTLRGVYHDWSKASNADSVWLLDQAQLTLPAGTPARNFFINGFLLPPSSDEPPAAGQLGLRLTINGAQSLDFFPLPTGHFNCGLDRPLVTRDEETKIEITLLGVKRANAFARLAQRISQWPLPLKWRAWAAAYQSHPLNRRLRLAQIVGDKQPIYDFAYANTHEIRRRRRVPPATHYLDNQLDRLRFPERALTTHASSINTDEHRQLALDETKLIKCPLYYEELLWSPPREATMSTPAQILAAYSVDGLFRDRRGMEVNPDTLWLRDRARVRLPAGTPTRNFFVNGFLLPESADHPEANGPLGLRLKFNGVERVDFFPLPINHFNCGITVSEPLIASDQPTEVEITLLGAERSNTLAWLGRLTAKWPLPRRWRQRLEAYRLQRLNQRLRLSQIIGDDEPIYDFKHATPLALARRWRTPPTGVNLVGWFRATLGVGESARCMARACDAADLPAALIDLRLNCLNPPSVDTFAARLQNANPHAVNIFHVDPPASEEIDHHHGANFRKDKYNIAYWAWELPEFPDHWVKQAAHFHEIWCPSAFVRDAIAAKVSRPVHVMPHAISFPTPAANGRERFKLPTDRFLFLFAYDLNSYQERKNPLAVVAAYRRAFPDERGVGLVIKTQNPERNTEAYARLQAALTGLQHAQIITEALPSADVHLLQAACDAFVSLHRAEGFGLSVAECMYLGKPVISTDWSATAEFVNVHNGCPVKCTLVKLTETHGPYQQGQIWAEPNVEHAAEWMQRLVNEPALAQTLGQQAAADMRERFAPAVIGARYRRRLEAFALWASEA
jgi:GT2 family glycosyltransferase/glycosyltransferase involved in cell wall biosynthesis